MSEKPAWPEIARKKREALLDAIPEKWRLTSEISSAQEQRDITGLFIEQYLSPREVEITNSNAVFIVKNTTTGAWKAREVLEAFCHRAALAHQMVPCLHEIFFNDALAEADALDTHYRTHGQPLGPLHGLPISLKDQLNIRNIDTTTGILSLIANRNTNPSSSSPSPPLSHNPTTLSPPSESTLVTLLRSLGAIPYVKTATPTASFASDTSSNLFPSPPFPPALANPLNRLTSAGGSSGGEAALLALHGSPLGFGSDIGGSIRGPAALCGLVGLKPSQGRLPFLGIERLGDGQGAGVGFVVGPLGRCVEDVGMVVREVLGWEPWRWDPDVVEMGWRGEVFEGVRRRALEGKGEERLCFGVLMDDGVVRPQPPARRAIEMVVKAVEALGHRVVEWKPPDHRKAISLQTGEPAPATLAGTFGNSPTTPSSVRDVQSHNIATRTYRADYLTYWRSTASLTGTGRPVDAIIAPTSPYASPLLGKMRYVGYTAAYNLLDYSVCVIPVTKAEKDVDKYEDGYEALGEQDRVCFEEYDAEAIDGAPVGLQIIGGRLQEEKVLALAEVLEKAVKDVGQQDRPAGKL
ncbi:MAG: hypothetical protein Q9165_004849 [Trypethelium subeluteriae]